MRSMMRPIIFFSASMIFGLLSACGGGGGGGSEGSSPASSSATATETQTGAGYVVTLIGEAGKDSYATALNNSGEVVGNLRQSDGSQNVFFWSAGKSVTTLIEGAVARDINDRGEMVGWLEGKSDQAFVHSGNLEVFDFPEGPSRSYGIDNEGRIVGRFTAGLEQAFWDDGGLTETLLPDLDGYATGLNDGGQVLIKALEEERLRALLLDADGTLIDLGTLGGANSQSQDINDAGKIVGWSQSVDGTYRAFLWSDGAMIDLSLPEWTYSSAVAINDSGQVLLKASSGTENRIYLWDEGEFIDLDSLGLDYAEVTDMNNQGQIVGWTVAEDGSFRAFLATPAS